MTKKLAIAISGAVSLGSFEAGVIYEVLEAIARHNENDQSQGNQIEIDIITGASAGGMTACILSHSLLFDGEALRKPYENPLYKAWVKEVDIVNLLQFKNNRDDQKRALLNVEKIEEVGKIYLPDKENTKGQKHLAVSSEIQIGIAMSNLNGFTYGIDTNQASIEYTRFKDRYICSVSREEDEEKGATAILREKELGLDGWEENPKPATWSMLRDVGIASGAFPFAFPLRPIFRKGLGKFWTRDSNIKAHKAPDSVHEGNYLYTDGGVFENEPVGLANLLIQGEQTPEQNRYVLLVKPGPRQSSNDPFLNRQENLFTTAIALLGAIFQQAQFRDWIVQGIKGEIFTITSEDGKLISDIVSAFSGFLEEKFRAHDYNIGRERARQELENAFTDGLINFNPVVQGCMPEIEWPYTCDNQKGHIEGKPVKNWKEAKSKLKDYAKVSIDKEGKRDELEELRRLMCEVNSDTRNIIRIELKHRLNYLFDFVIEEYVSPTHSSTWFQRWVKIPFRKRISRPTFKRVLGILLDIWMENNIFP